MQTTSPRSRNACAASSKSTTTTTPRCAPPPLPLPRALTHTQNTFYALYRSFTQCVYVDDDEPVVFYRNRRGEAVRDVARDELARVDARWDADEQDSGAKAVE